MPKLPRVGRLETSPNANKPWGNIGHTMTLGTVHYLWAEGGDFEGAHFFGQVTDF